jgi:peptidyl-prolyl cis-trans isomerase C
MTCLPPPRIPPDRRYHVLRTALALYGRTPQELVGGELAEAQEKAAQAYAVEERVLASREAQRVVVSRAAVDAAFADVVARYATRGELHSDLAANGLDEALLRRALRRELICERVLAQIAATAPPVTDAEVAAYYAAHPARFLRPALRTACQILITVNPDFPENTREAAYARVTELHARVLADPSSFAALAERWSECPSALRGGLLGTVPHGRLAPEIDAVLFSLAPGEIGPVVESDLGFHIILCEEVYQEQRLPLDEVRDRIRERLEEERRRQVQQAWLRDLPACA